MAPRFHTTQQSFCVNLPANLIGEQDKLTGVQGPAKRFNIGSNKAPTLFEAPIPPLVLSPAKDIFTKFIKVFIETMQAQALAKLQKYSLKSRAPEAYWGKSSMECYHFCQQCEDYFKTSGATGMNRTLFAASYLRGSISLKWAQHKRHHKSATLIT